MLPISGIYMPASVAGRPLKIVTSQSAILDCIAFALASVCCVSSTWRGCLADATLQGFSYVCEQEEYYDGVDRKCIACHEICGPDMSEQFCHINCPGYRQPDKTTNVTTKSSTIRPENSNDPKLAENRTEAKQPLNAPTSQPLTSSIDNFQPAHHDGISSSLLVVVIIGISAFVAIFIILAVSSITVFTCNKYRDERRQRLDVTAERLKRDSCSLQLLSSSSSSTSPTATQSDGGTIRDAEFDGSQSVLLQVKPCVSPASVHSCCSCIGNETVTGNSNSPASSSASTHPFEITFSIKQQQSPV